MDPSSRSEVERVLGDDATSEADGLLSLVDAGDAQALNRLLDRYRARLRHVVSLRMQSAMAVRVDPSDVVQESLAEAVTRLPGYLKDRPLPFYLWLRRLALERLIDLYRRHVLAQKRSVRREEAPSPAITDGSLVELANRFVSRGSSPSQRVRRDELRTRIQGALEQLGERDREVLVLRHLEQLSIAEIAQVLEINEGAVRVRHLRALQRLRAQLDGLWELDGP